jgi:hypothetical protein
MTTRLKELLELSSSNHKSSFYWDIAKELFINYYEHDGYSDYECPNYYSQNLIVWYSRESYLGLTAHYLNDKLIAISYQISEYGLPNFYWLSLESLKEFRERLISSIKLQWDSLNARLAELKSEVGEIEYAIQNSVEVDSRHKFIDDFNFDSEISYLIKNYKDKICTKESAQYDKIKHLVD